jgi:membrane dipeptidase
MTANVAHRVRQAMASVLVWDNHGAMPYRPGETLFLPQLERYRRSGARVVGLKIVYGPLPTC